MATENHNTAPWWLAQLHTFDEQDKLVDAMKWAMQIHEQWESLQTDPNMKDWEIHWASIYRKVLAKL